MYLLNLLRNLFSDNKRIDPKKLPSLGFFYNEDFTISIKKATIEDITEYEFEFSKEDLGLTIEKLKRIVEKNTIFNKEYSFSDIKSIDLIFIFFEIVNFTKSKPIFLIYEESGKFSQIEFNSKNFNYYIPDDEIATKYNQIEKCFKIDGYSYTLPSVGVENSLTEFLISKSISKELATKYSNLSYNFTYFLGQKNSLTFEEIENLIQIFNFDMDKEEINKVSRIVKSLAGMQKYSLQKDGKIIEINSKLDLEKIWK